MNGPVYDVDVDVGVVNDVDYDEDDFGDGEIWVTNSYSGRNIISHPRISTQKQSHQQSHSSYQFSLCSAWSSKLARAMARP